MKAFVGVCAIVFAGVLFSWFLKGVLGGMLKCNFTDIRMASIPCIGLATVALGAFVAASGVVISWMTKRG